LVVLDRPSFLQRILNGCHSPKSPTYTLSGELKVVEDSGIDHRRARSEDILVRVDTGKSGITITGERPQFGRATEQSPMFTPMLTRGVDPRAVNSNFASRRARWGSKQRPTTRSIAIPVFLHSRSVGKSIEAAREAVRHIWFQHNYGSSEKTCNVLRQPSFPPVTMRTNGFLQGFVASDNSNYRVDHNRKPYKNER
jgi:hypothetical protein